MYGGRCHSAGSRTMNPMPPNPAVNRTCAKSRAGPVNSNVSPRRNDISHVIHVILHSLASRRSVAERYEKYLVGKFLFVTNKRRKACKKTLFHISTSGQGLEP